jgi:hypothetical protein
VETHEHRTPVQRLVWCHHALRKYSQLRIQSGHMENGELEMGKLHERDVVSAGAARLTKR